MLLSIMVCATVTNKITYLILVLLKSYDLLITSRFMYSKAGHSYEQVSILAKIYFSMQQVLAIYQSVLQDLPVYLEHTL